MPSVAFYTLGCKVNFYDTEAIWQLFKKEGYEQVDFETTDRRCIFDQYVYGYEYGR